MNVGVYGDTISGTFNVIFNQHAVNPTSGKNGDNTGSAGPFATDVNCGAAACLLALNTILAKAQNVFQTNEVVLNTFVEPGLLDNNSTSV